MRALRDLLVTVAVLLALVSGLAALPFLIISLVIIGTGFILYAFLHDRRIAEEQRQRDLEVMRNNEDNSSPSEHNL